MVIVEIAMQVAMVVMDRLIVIVMSAQKVIV